MLAISCGRQTLTNPSALPETFFWQKDLPADGAWQFGSFTTPISIYRATVVTLRVQVASSPGGKCITSGTYSDYWASLEGGGQKLSSWGLNVGDGFEKYEVFQEASTTESPGDYQLVIRWAYVHAFGTPCTLSVTLEH
jgi:hypothetical protein